MTDSSRQLAVIASTMRSGSTLLKALLGQAPDISKLNEVNFQQYCDPKKWEAMWQMAPERILLFKRPGWYHEIGRYPRLPDVPGLKIIVLVRDVYDSVESLRRMTFGRFQSLASPIVDWWLATRYWLGTSQNLFQLSRQRGSNCRLVRYEDLVKQPVHVTSNLFDFLGSVQQTGVERYSEPPDRRWRWGRDDNSPNIRSLSVLPPTPREPDNRRLVKIISDSSEIQKLRCQLGYVTG